MTRFCHQCGAQVQDAQRFCNKCGAPLAATQPTAGTPPPGPQYAPPPPSSGYQQTPGYGQYPYQPPPPPASGDLRPNVAGMLCYPLSVMTGLLFLILTPYNRDRFVKFHAYQAIFFFAALLVLNVALRVLLPWPLEGVMLGFLRLAALGGTAYSMYKAWQGEKFKLPLIGDMAEQQANKP
ncbi:MAG: zinc-ribbon domain-containing protein [Blastocatellia bacterium]|nr:zinc-ribbon domain-containing protein [Blastocatellia bacterium]